MAISWPKHSLRSAACLALLLLACVPVAHATTVTPGAVTPTPTAARTLEPRVQLGAGSSEPTGPTRIDVALHDAPASLANLEQRIAFAPSAPVLANADGSPDCDLRPDLDGNFVFSPEGCDPRRDCTTLLATVHGLENNAGNGLLFTCTFDIADPAAFEECTEPLLCGANLATNGLGVEIPLDCGDGVLSSRFPDADISFALAVDPAPQVGKTFHLTVTPSLLNDADVGRVDMALVAASPPPFEGDLIESSASLAPIVFDLTATQAGATQVVVRFDYETTGGCPGHEVDDSRVLFSEPFALDIAEAPPPSSGGGCRVVPDGTTPLPLALAALLLLALALGERGAPRRTAARGRAALPKTPGQRTGPTDALPSKPIV